MENIPQDIKAAMAKFNCIEEKELGRCKTSLCKFKHLRDTNGNLLHPSQFGNRAGVKNRVVPPAPVPASSEITKAHPTGAIQHGTPLASKPNTFSPGTPTVALAVPARQSDGSVQQAAASIAPFIPVPVSTSHLAKGSRVETSASPAPTTPVATRPKIIDNFSQTATQPIPPTVPNQRPAQPIKTGRYYGNSAKLTPPVLVGNSRLSVPAALQQGSIAGGFAILTSLTAPIPKETTKEENDFLMYFKAPLRDPNMLPEVERRNLLEQSVVALGHNNDSIKLYAARLLTEPLSLAHLSVIVNALICSGDSIGAGEQESDFFTPVAFLTRCIPLMKLLSHPFWETNNGTKACLSYIFNTVFRDVKHNTHFIVRSIGSFSRDNEQQRLESESVDWPETYSIMIRCFIRFAKVSTCASSFLTADIVTYWMLPFVELARDIWYPEDAGRKVIFDDLAILIDFYRLKKYFPTASWLPTQRSSLNDIRRLACENSRKSGYCASYEAGVCYFRHDEIDLLKKFAKKEDSKFEMMNQWMRSSKANDKLTGAELKRFWDEGLGLFNSGNESFVLEVLSLPEGLVLVSRTMEPRFVGGKPISLDFMEPFIKIFSDKRLNSEKYSTAGGPAAKIAEVCAKHAKIFKYMIEYLKGEPLSDFRLDVAISMIGLARFIVDFNPIQKIQEEARDPLKELCRAIAVSSDAGTQQMTDAHKVGDRLGFTIRQNLLDNKVEIADQDVPAPDAVDTFDEPLVFNDSDDVKPGAERAIAAPEETQTTEEIANVGTADLDYTYTDALEKAIMTLRELLSKPPVELPNILDKMEANGEIAILKSFFKRNHVYIPDPQQRTTKPSIFRHFVQFFGKICLWPDGNTWPKDFTKNSPGAILFNKLWGPGEFVPFLKVALRDLYIMHKDRGIYEEGIRRLYRKSAEGLIMVIAIAVHTRYLPPTDPEFRSLILRVFRIFTDPRDDMIFCDPKVYGRSDRSSGYESWKVVHSAIMRMLPELEMEHLFRMEHVGRSKTRERPLFKHPLTFTCPDRKLSKCAIPEFCQFVHLSEDLSSPGSLSEIGSDDDTGSIVSRNDNFLGVGGPMEVRSESFVSYSASES
ncbi:hypothetical protein AA313_de0208315 [Arthrobotrys entomopaga]|nr:hypothetical protein AA313_de0208315 [Arthrobotrys entomopaga]